MSKNTKLIKQKGTVLKNEADIWRNLRTGEEVVMSEVLKPVGRRGFVIAYLSAIVEMIETLGNKKMQVVKHILANMDKSTNIYLTTTRELCKATGISSRTVTETLKLLENAQIISRRLGAIMVNPRLLHTGRESKERALLMRFYTFDDGHDPDVIDGTAKTTHDQLMLPE